MLQQHLCSELSLLNLAVSCLESLVCSQESSDSFLGTKTKDFTLLLLKGTLKVQ